MTGRELAHRAPRFGVHAFPLVHDRAIEPGDDLRVWLEHVDRHPAPRRHVLAHARETRPTIVRIEHEEGIERDEDQGEPLVEGERPHVALDPAHLDICSPGASFGPLEHRGGTIEADDVVALLRDRHRDTAGAAAELEDRAPRPARESAEPLDVGAALERGDPEIVESREACCL